MHQTKKEEYRVKKSIIALSIFSGASIFNIANAAGEDTVSIGYAQSYAKIYGSNEDAKGVNLKYRHELDDVIGVIGSLTYTNEDANRYDGKVKGNAKYWSLMAGPSFRANDYISAYAMAGLAQGKYNIDVRDGSGNGIGHADDKKTALAGSVGVQVNPAPNWVIDTSFEYAKLMDSNVKTWTVGVGYRF